ncbi:hypothetical protein SDC9_98503 [bioreactor metagenome]|uniref:Glycosyltransferase subfamily 4-like N-terminal domain-containing protein n=1 Tax=bioreactor metagenome TaxID=1076179 RepID=A0A645AEY0_9ZZZZ|nr:glycosyltransferase [Rikenellaceae bacterium]
MALVKHIFPIPPPYGGVSIYVYRLVQKLNDEGHIAGAYHVCSEMTENQIDASIYTPYKGFSRKRFLSSFIRLTKDTRKYEIVHSHSVFSDSIYLLLLVFFYKKKIVVTIHNDRAFNNYLKQNLISKLCLKILARYNITWVAVSEKAMLELKKIPIKIQNISIIPAFIPFSQSLHYSYNLPVEMNTFIDNHSSIIVFYAYKVLIDYIDIYGCYDVLNMFKSINVGEFRKWKPGLVFCITNVSEDDCDVAKLKFFSKKNNIDSDIYWQIGPIQEMERLWQQTTVYVRPTVNDGDSVAIREALSMGVSVVASNVTTRPINTILYQHGNNDDFSNKVKTAIKQAKAIRNHPNYLDFTYYNQILAIYKKLHTSE